MKGKLGASFNDRELAGQVRNLALDHLKRVLDPNYKDKKYQREMLLKLASNLLPRLSELTGADGAPLTQVIIKNAERDNLTPQAI